jgi:Na+/H+-dicarboxylate symporter
MIISPLVFTTLVVGIAKLGDIKAVGRIGGKVIAFYSLVYLIWRTEKRSTKTPDNFS